MENDGFENECVIKCANGMEIRCDGVDPTGTDYVRVCDSEGNEIAYWCCDEWQESPREVMGAILGACVKV